MSGLPLDGIRVLDLTQVYAGPTRPSETHISPFKTDIYKMFTPTVYDLRK